MAQIINKFKMLSDSRLDASFKEKLISMVKDLERIRIRDLTRVLEKIGKN